MDEVKLPPDDNVIEFRPGDFPPLEERRKPGHDPLIYHCQHRQVWIDRKPRGLTCKTCGAMVDPVDYLIYLSGQWKVLGPIVAGLKRERQQLEEEIAELKKVRATQRAAVRRGERR